MLVQKIENKIIEISMLQPLNPKPGTDHFKKKKPGHNLAGLVIGRPYLD
jgi:hypothetical protein